MNHYNNHYKNLIVSIKQFLNVLLLTFDKINYLKQI